VQKRDSWQLGRGTERKARCRRVGLARSRCYQTVTQRELEGKYSLESTDPRESEIRAPPQLTIALKLSCYLFIIAELFKGQGRLPEVCLQYKNPRFAAFLDSNLHTRLAIVTENEPGLAFPRRNLPKKFRPDPSTFYLVVVVTNRQTDRQTDRQTNAGKNMIPRFRGDNKLWTER